MCPDSTPEQIREEVEAMRIYLAISTFLPAVGGAEKQALSHARGLQARGHAVTVVTIRHDDSWPAREIMEGIPVVRSGGTVVSNRDRHPRLARKFLYALAIASLGWRLWRDRRCYDAVHLYQLNALALPVALVCWLAGKPLLVSIRCSAAEHGAIGPTQARMVAGDLDPTLPWLQVVGPTHTGGDLEHLLQLGQLAVHVTRALLKHIGATVVVLTPNMRRDLQAHGFGMLETYHIPNGVETARFSPCEYGDVDADTVQRVICVSRLVYQKGIDVLLHAWSIVHEQAPQARLLVVGAGPLRAQLERLVDALNLRASVEFTGVRNDVALLLRRSAIAAQPSRFEGMPNAVLEVMASGLPCVATAVSGNEDLVEDHVNGLLVPAEDYRALADALLSLLRSPDIARQYGVAARRTVEAHYESEHVIERWITLYEAAIARRTRAVTSVCVSGAKAADVERPN